MNLPRYEVIESKRYRHLQSNRTASIYGACPWTCGREKAGWILETVGWTVRDNNTNTVGFGRIPFETRELAEEFAGQLGGSL